MGKNGLQRFQRPDLSTFTLITQNRTSTFWALTPVVSEPAVIVMSHPAASTEFGTQKKFTMWHVVQLFHHQPGKLWQDPKKTAIRRSEWMGRWMFQTAPPQLHADPVRTEPLTTIFRSALGAHCQAASVLWCPVYLPHCPQEPHLTNRNHCLTRNWEYFFQPYCTYTCMQHLILG